MKDVWDTNGRSTMVDDILKVALELPLSERRALVNEIRKSIVNEEHANCALERYDVVKSIVESTTGYIINPRRRMQSDVTGRMYIAYIMYNDGYTLSCIGKLIGRNHDSTLHLIKKMEDMLSVPGAYKREISILKEIKERLCQINSNDTL